VTSGAAFLGEMFTAWHALAALLGLALLGFGGLLFTRADVR
jgi:hypothetical protein